MSKHAITPGEAKAMIAAYAADAEAKGIPFSEDYPRNIGFDAVILQELFHPEAVKVRVHHAIHDGKKTVVIASHSADGTILAATQNGEFCPPLC